MVGSVSGMSRANGLRQDLDAGLHQDVEDWEVAPTGGERPLAVRDKSLEEMAKFLEVDSLGFLSVEGLYEALDCAPRDPAAPQFTDHYFTGDYPTRLLDREIAEGRNDGADRQLSFLVDA